MQQIERRSLNERLTAIAPQALPLFRSAPPTVAIAWVPLDNAKAKIRSGPGLEFPVVAIANPGFPFGVLGRSHDLQWWQVCCIGGAKYADPLGTGWMYSPTITLRGAADAVPIVAGVLPANLTARWAVSWQCAATGKNCHTPPCTGAITAAIPNPSLGPWQTISQATGWDPACGSGLDAAQWTFEVNQYSGQERSEAFLADFVYNYWAGLQPGVATHLFTMDDGRRIAVHCSGPQTKEVPEQDGYVTVYTGEVCHDVHTGMMVTLTYTKKWLFSGKIGEQSYTRAFFGDEEALDQYLVDSNADLYIVR